MPYHFTKQTFDTLRSQEAIREVKTEKNKDKVIAGLRGRISTLNYLILKRVKFSGK